jgi:serine/threonine-protein kinase
MSRVWAARLRGTRGFQKLVAIKTLFADGAEKQRLEPMLLAEARLAAQIQHPNVAQYLDLGERDGVLFVVMEWVDGESLNVLMHKAASQGGVPLPIGVNLIGQACQGLYAAHNLRNDEGTLLGVVHRDVSPHNVLVTFSGTAKLVDFGIAKVTSLASSTEVGEVKGKFAYMAPEQVRAAAVDARTDLFALGILLYQITTGKHPFRGENPAETLQNICADRGPTPPSAFLPDYPAELEAVVLKALAKNPAQRFSSANEMLTALERAMPGPLEASFEVQVGEYLKQLFGPRASERRSAIDSTNDGGSSQTPGRTSSPSLQRMTPTPTPTPFPRGRTKQLVAATVGALAVIAGALMLRSASGPISSQKAAASGMVAVETIMPSAAKISSPPPAPALQAAPNASASAEPERSAEVTKKGARERKAPPRGGRSVAGGAFPVTPSGQPSATAVAPPTTGLTTTTSTAAAAASVGSPPANTLGRGAFGGRH